MSLELITERNLHEYRNLTNGLPPFDYGYIKRELEKSAAYYTNESKNLSSSKRLRFLGVALTARILREKLYVKDKMIYFLLDEVAQALRKIYKGSALEDVLDKPAKETQERIESALKRIKQFERKNKLKLSLVDATIFVSYIMTALYPIQLKQNGGVYSLYARKANQKPINGLCYVLPRKI